MSVSICPVCDGRGSVNKGFYEGGPRMTPNVCNPAVKCRACNGSGVIRSTEYPAIPQTLHPKPNTWGRF